MRKLAIDLDRYAWRVHRGELTLIGTWLLSDEKKPPCMVIIRRNGEFSPHRVPCVIPLERAWIWDRQAGDSAQRTFAAFEICERLSLKPTGENIVKLMLSINHVLEDLIKMPPYPHHAFDNMGKGEIIGVGAITNHDGGQVREFEIKNEEA